MLFSEGATVLEMAAESGNVHEWASIVKVLREELSPEQVNSILGQSVPVLRVELYQVGRPPFVHRATSIAEMKRGHLQYAFDGVNCITPRGRFHRV